MIKTCFEVTPLMSTYTFAFALTKYKPQELGRVSLYSTLGKTTETQYILSETENFLNLYEKYFNHSYILPKLDLLSINYYGSPTAVENWGIISINKQFILDKDQQVSAKSLQATSALIAHEVAHQWFGNDVTLHWWNETWLNEGFATFFEYFIVDKAHPTWRMMELFSVVKMKDALNSNVMLSEPITENIQLELLSGNIAYAKGITKLISL